MRLNSTNKQPLIEISRRNEFSNGIRNRGVEKEVHEIDVDVLIEHPDTATSMYNLAIVLTQIGGNERANELFQKALEIRKEKLGTNHPDTLKIIENYNHS